MAENTKSQGLPSDDNSVLDAHVRERLNDSRENLLPTDREATSRLRSPLAFEITHQGRKYRFPTVEAYHFLDAELRQFSQPDSTVPLTLDLNDHDPCAARCVYCFTEAGGSYHPSHEPPVRYGRDISKTHLRLTQDEFLEIIRQYALLGGRNVFLCSEGETCSRPKRLLEKIRVAREAGLRVLIASNIMMITESVARQLYDYGVNIVAKFENLHPGGNEAIILPSKPYDYVPYRGQRVPKQLAEILRIYQDHPQRIAIASLMTRMNLDCILAMRRWAYEELGVAHFLNVIYWAGFADKNKCRIDFSAQYRQVLEDQIHSFDQSHGLEYPYPSHEYNAFDIRRFLNTAVNSSGFPIRVVLSSRGGFYLSAPCVYPEFNYGYGVEVSVRNTMGFIDLSSFFSGIQQGIHSFNSQNFFEVTQSDRIVIEVK